MKKFIFFLVLSLFTLSAYAADVTLAWDLSASDSGIVGYRIYASKTSGNYSTIAISVPRGATTATLRDLPPGLWYFVATAYTNDVESDKSNEVSNVVKPSPIRIKIVNPNGQ